MGKLKSKKPAGQKSSFTAENKFKNKKVEPLKAIKKSIFKSSTATSTGQQLNSKSKKLIKENYKSLQNSSQIVSSLNEGPGQGQKCSAADKYKNLLKKIEKVPKKAKLIMKREKLYAKLEDGKKKAVEEKKKKEAGPLNLKTLLDAIKAKRETKEEKNYQEIAEDNNDKDDGNDEKTNKKKMSKRMLKKKTSAKKRQKEVADALSYFSTSLSSSKSQ